MNKIYIRATVLAVLAIASSAWAQLKWDKREVSLTPKVDEKQVVAEFPFTNAGTEEVTITSIKTSCDSCTAAQLATYTFKPGEGGVVKVTFNIGQRTGLQAKTILVQTTDKKEGNVLLTMKVKLPDLLDVSSRFVWWQQGSEKKAQKINVKVQPGVAMKLTSVKSNSPKITAELQTSEDGKEYAIVLTPTDTSQPLSGFVTVQATGPDKKPRTFRLLARVLPQGPTTQPVQTGK